MSWSVGQVSGFAGVTVRTLHYYDRSGLLSPSERSPAGYRLYSAGDLTRLQQILFYRELGFPLEEIATILADPQANALDHLLARRQVLTEQITRLQKLVEVAERAIEVQTTGVELTPEQRFEAFGDVVFDLSYATDAHLKWGDREGHQESLARAATHTKEDWRQLMAEAAVWRARLLAAFDQGLPADHQEALDLAEEHRQHITRWFTPCPPEMHCRIADDYEADARAFALVVPPAEQRPGLAPYLRAAIGANARHLAEEPAGPEHVKEAP
ncbi:MerR family transcriptional regulator [Kitasatospora aureofaciens]|uniref:MerR family transcriptional regulator n=1 Tax=Kitasatospora aureofaciens TaxID=1894 RepID=UPI000527DF2E|nr:MerR family transcriptional regulator [Kitasatospora aureofaciens]HJD80642.1 MerR family transcriptional regulator [Kitasatospora aureofaciens]